MVCFREARVTGGPSAASSVAYTEELATFARLGKPLPHRLFHLLPRGKADLELPLPGPVEHALRSEDECPNPARLKLEQWISARQKSSSDGQKVRDGTCAVNSPSPG